MIWSSVRECQEMLGEAIFGWQPAKLDLLEIRDHMTENQPGWLFLRDPRNGLQHSFRHLQRQAFTKERLMKGKKWCLPRCQEYLARVDALRKQILVCVHFTGGLPGRGTEVTTIKWCNTRQVMRNVFVYNGRLITVLEYNKTRSSTNNSFYIVRVLPLVVSKILFQDIAYVRPFCEALVHQLKLQRTKVPAYYFFTSQVASTALLFCQGLLTDCQEALLLGHYPSQLTGKLH
jgi:hypothetical protein